MLSIMYGFNQMNCEDSQVLGMISTSSRPDDSQQIALDNMFV